MEADYPRFTHTKSLKFKLAYAEGFEVVTFAGDRANFRSRVFDRLNTIRNRDRVKLIMWPALEEAEHSTVTFNIDDDVYGTTYIKWSPATTATTPFSSTSFFS